MSNKLIDELPEDNPWYIPEPKTAIIEAENCSKEEVINSVIHAPNLNWDKWITINNADKQYRINSDTLLALNNYSCFYGSAGVETCIFISSIIIDKDDLDAFVDKLSSDKDLSKRVSNPVDWHGGIVSSCYITPKEVCWFPWKKDIIVVMSKISLIFLYSRQSMAVVIISLNTVMCTMIFRLSQSENYLTL